MGYSYLFECHGCGYIADVCDGVDSGFIVTVRTSVCRDCSRLVDVVLAYHDRQEPSGREGDADIGHCPDCGGANVVKWKKSHLCPKCGKCMKKGDVITLWD